MRPEYNLRGGHRGRYYEVYKQKQGTSVVLLKRDVRITGVPADADDVLFQAVTPLGFVVRVTRRRWALIVTAKHPVMAGRESVVTGMLENPDEIRQSRTDAQVLLFYKAEATKRWTCAVVKRLADGAFLITAYPTDAIKEGVRIWLK